VAGHTVAAGLKICSCDVYGGTWIGAACWWYLPSCMNQRDVPMPRIDHVGVTNMWGRYPHINARFIVDGMSLY
jgi:hypothetical protein